MEEIAQVYARSLFEVAQAHGTLDRIRTELGEFSGALEANRELAVFFFSPYFSTEEKKQALDRSIGGADETTRNFLELLVEKHRMPVVFRVRRTLDALWEEENKLLPVEITSAIALDPAVVARLQEEIGRQTGRRVQLTETIDPDVLGGLVLRVGNQILDASIRTRLDGLRKQVARV